jgi:hypothetical protein
MITSECFEDTAEQVSAPCSKIKHPQALRFTGYPGVQEAQLFQQWKYDKCLFLSIKCELSH